MEFLTEYGLFLAKTATIVIAIGIVIGLAVSAGMKNQDGGSKGHIDVNKMNERFDQLSTALESIVLPPEELKAQTKEKKKKAKALEKQRKADAKKSDSPAESKKRVFVTEFEGDIKASAAEELREVVTAILSIAGEQDEVVVKLESPGGMVHSYGFAASQLRRITSRNIHLTVCVDKVAASGGYMMACVGDKILSAPFAVIGSIGVLAQLPNFHRLLKKHDVDYEMFTAGKYKRTVTMFGENTEQGKEKFTEELEDTHELFKDFIRENREQVNVDEVATGETWFGLRALERNLVDEIGTSDQYLYDLKDEADIYQVCYVQKKSLPEKLGVSVEHSVDRVISRWWQRINNRLV